ncbi:hypothetical protein DSUL_30084 [Desulfovibrionales bacterium]
MNLGLFSCQGACVALESGAVVTVDAMARRVYYGRQEAVLVAAHSPYIPMRHRSVYATLKTAAEYIMPLHLFNPAAPEFKPANCWTMHDILRFCHNKVVAEIFVFGQAHCLPERYSRQLICKVPMQYWIIDLDDCFSGPPAGRFIHLEHITSIPMLALWRGIVAIPWRGRLISFTGFISVFMEATTNPELVASLPTHYTDRNYFLISKNYCTLQARYGFHYLYVEALVEDHPIRNYVNFQFKGGAANLHRRVCRARMVARMLEHFGFTVELFEDTVFATIEGKERSIMEINLEILGYLLIHTRQLDMVLDSDEDIEIWQAKLFNDIAQIIMSAASAIIGTDTGIS